MIHSVAALGLSELEQSAECPLWKLGDNAGSWCVKCRERYLLAAATEASACVDLLPVQALGSPGTAAGMRPVSAPANSLLLSDLIYIFGLMYASNHAHSHAVDAAPRRLLVLPHGSPCRGLP